MQQRIRVHLSGPGLAHRLAGMLVAGPALALLLAGCQRQVPEADLFAEAPPPPPSTVSRFSAPVEYDFSGVISALERVVPTRFGSLDSVRMLGLDPRKHYAFEAERGPFTVFADGKLLHLRATVTYSARGYYKPFLGPTISAGCGSADARPRLVLELATPLTLTKDWHLASHTRVSRIEPASSSEADRCQVSALKLDVTPKVVEAARSALSKHLGDIDRKVATVDLGDRFAGWWGALSRPIRLRDDVWLVLSPERVEMGGVRGSGHVLTVPVSVEARPRIVTAVDEPVVQAADLPPLGHGSGADGYHVLVDGVIDYAMASQAVSAALANKEVSKAGHTARIRQVSVAPGPRGRLELTVAFEGDATGMLRLSGTPLLDGSGSEITVPDLDYDLSTDNKLVDAYAWLRSDALRATMREKARVPVAPALEKGRALLLKGLNRPLGKAGAATLSGTVDSVRVRAIYATRGGLIVRAEATGQAGLAVHPVAHPAAHLAREPETEPGRSSVAEARRSDGAAGQPARVRPAAARVPDGKAAPDAGRGLSSARSFLGGIFHRATTHH